MYIDKLTGLVMFGTSGGGGGGSTGGGAGKFYECASVDDGGTWSGYEWLLTTTEEGESVYTKSETLTDGLSWTSVKPKVGKSYTDDALVEVAAFATALNELSTKIQSGYYTEANLGNILSFNHATFGMIAFEIVQVDKADVVGGRQHSITLMSKNVLRHITVDGRESSGAPNSRSSYGYALWKESNLRQWLNSNKPTPWFEPQNTYDQPPSSSHTNESRGAYDTADGFMCGFDADFLKSVATVRNVNAIGDNQSEVTEDRFFLPSITEMGDGNNRGVAEGVPFSNFTKAKTGPTDQYFLRSMNIATRYSNDVLGNYYYGYSNNLDGPTAPCDGYTGLVVCCVLY